MNMYQASTPFLGLCAKPWLTARAVRVSMNCSTIRHRRAADERVGNLVVTRPMKNGLRTSQPGRRHQGISLRDLLTRPNHVWCTRAYIPACAAAGFSCTRSPWSCNRRVAWYCHWHLSKYPSMSTSREALHGALENLALREGVFSVCGG